MAWCAASGRLGHGGRRCVVWLGLGRSWRCWRPSRARRPWLTNRSALRSGNPAGPGRVVRRAAPDARPAAGLVRGFTNAEPSPRAPLASVDGIPVSLDHAGGGADGRPLPLFAPPPGTPRTGNAASPGGVLAGMDAKVSDSDPSGARRILIACAAMADLALPAERVHPRCRGARALRPVVREGAMERDDLAWSGQSWRLPPWLWLSVAAMVAGTLHILLDASVGLFPARVASRRRSRRRCCWSASSTPGGPSPSRRGRAAWAAGWRAPRSWGSGGRC
jgi:hypothetical protein